MKLVLIGYMGSGKSAVGNQLANTLNYNYFDLDSEIEKHEGTTISIVFEQKGEIYFRRKENELLKALISENSRMVLSTGGGTPCYGGAMTFLLEQKDVIAIYLKASLEIVTKRLFEEQIHRPLIAHIKSEAALKDFIRKHLFERSHYYNQASVVINTDGYSVEEIVREIVARLF